jgi:hypothetical protein
MIVLLQIIIALIVGFLLAAAIGLALSRRWMQQGSTFPKVAYVWLFLILFLAAWATGTWTQPMGPPLYGLYWLPFFWGSLLLGLLVLMLYWPDLQSPGRFGGRNTVHHQRQIATLDAFFWLSFIAILALLAAIFLMF